MARLRPADRDVLLLRFFEGLSFREVAQRLAKNDAAVQK
ncbi:MAG: sigma factor-like helix-turn-helix DNA-binding protein [Verrucomicrobiales bacterium]